MSEVETLHAHVYFDASTIDQARRLCTECRDRFGVFMGRVHERPVGPHPDWSCQLTIRREQFGDVLLWLALNRNGLTILCHPSTGDGLKDHTEHAIWLGQPRPLNLEQYRNPDQRRPS
ncbi:MAG TPA: DOPA 4,5-dioxygenase family protein [Hyphomicrobiaceae bacterium]|nr:DOPA 4,5-dioxygenase family protein [Hyphomicrobiaceae bacterium]